MMTRSANHGTSAFRIRRSVMTANGFSTAVEPLVAEHLAELNGLLARRIFGLRDGGGHAAHKGAKAAEADKAHAPGPPGGNGHEHLAALRLKLTPRKTPRDANEPTSWARDSLGEYLTQQPEAEDRLSLADYIDRQPELAQLKYGFLDALQEDWAELGANDRAVLEGHPAITDYLIAHAYEVMKVREPLALRHFVLDHRAGTRRVADYATVGAARSLVHDEQLRVERYNDDAGPFHDKLLAAPTPLSATAFLKAVRDLIDEFMFDRDEEGLIDGAHLGKLPDGVKPLLVRMMQRSPIAITAQNASMYLPNFVLQILKFKGVPEPRPGDDVSADEDFEVQFEDDAAADGTLEFSRSAVLCAAQLYHGMVMGEELDVFGAVNYLVFQRPHLHGAMRISDAALREDLQLYALDNQFADLRRRKAGRLEDRPLHCTRAAERQMFHRLVFDEGAGQLPDDLPVNEEFTTQWNVLMLESARYLERAQSSFNPESFVSPQNVMQAVEDLQYNLSTHCTGMATVVSPRADAELNFVMERILKHKDVIRHVVPEGGTWKQVVDRLNIERRVATGKAMTLHNKAVLGKGIIEAIANYTPAAFEDDGVFSAFISKVDAFITTQSILMRPRLAQLRDDPPPRGESPAPAERVSAPAEKAPAGTADEWDF